MAAVTDVWTYIKEEGLAGEDTGWGLYRRRLPDENTVPQVVVVSEDGGGAPEMSADTGSMGDAALTDPAVMVTVRGAPWDSDSSRAKAGEIFTLLNGKRDIVLVSAGQRYLRIKAQTPEPIFAGFDDQNRPLHTISFRMLRLVG